MKTIIREYRSADLEPVRSICNLYITGSTATFDLDPLDREQMAGRLDSALELGLPVLVAESEGRVVGYGYLHPWKARAAYWPTLEITVYLALDAVGKGMGRCLVSQLLTWTRQSGRYRSVIACITADNDRSIALFRSMGFQKVSEFLAVGEKFGRRLDVVDLQLLL